MPEMKDSGIEWIGMIPKNWNVDKIKYHLKRNEPKNPGNVEVLSVYREYGVIPKNSRDDNHNITSEDTSKYKYVKKGDLVINKMKAWQGSMGVSEYEGIVSPAYFIYNFTDNYFDKKYFHFLIRNCYKDEFRRISGGIREGQWDLSADLFADELVLIPPIKEQIKIVEFLNTKCAEIDTLYSDIEKQIEILEEYKKSIITEAVTKGLDPDVEMKDSGIEWMGMVPSTWESNKVLNCIDFIGGSQPPLSYFEGEEKEGYVRLIQNRDYKTDDYMTFVPKRMVTKFCEVDDVMIGRYGPPLFVLHRGLKGAYNVAIMKAVPKLLDREFMAFYLQNYTLLQYIESFSKRTAGQAGVNTDILKKYPIYVPPMEEQKEIAIYLEKKCIEIDNVIGKKKEQLETLEQYKKSLIYEYVTGKKEVSNE
ncbi:MAG: restriction endonuclease subunit S [Clostridium sp.]